MKTITRIIIALFVLNGLILNAETRDTVVNLSAGPDGLNFATQTVWDVGFPSWYKSVEGFKTWIHDDGVNDTTNIVCWGTYNNFFDDVNYSWYFAKVTDFELGMYGKTFLVFPPIDATGFTDIELSIQYQNGTYTNVAAANYYVSENDADTSTFTGDYDLSEWDLIGSTPTWVSGGPDVDSTFSIPYEYSNSSTVRILVELDLDNVFAYQEGGFYCLKKVVMTGEGGSTSISSVEENGLSVFPNPTDGIVTVQSHRQSEAAVTLSTLSGAAVYEGTITATDNTIDVAQFGSGVYLLKVLTGNTQLVRKVIVK